MTYIINEWNAAQKKQITRAATPQEVIKFDLEKAAPPPTPQVVTMRQAKLALYLAGNKLAVIEAALEALPEPQRTLALIEWHEATEVKRDWPLVLMMAPLIGTKADIDNLFSYASTL